MKDNKIICGDKEKEQIYKLLDELGEIKGPEKLPEWNMKAETLLVFLACKNPLMILDTGVPVKEQRAGQLASEFKDG